MNRTAKKRRQFRLLIMTLFFLTGSFMFLGENVYAADADWYLDYTYTLDEENHYIKLERYNKSEFVQEYILPAKATVDGVEYTTFLEGGKEESIWEDASINKMSFESGIALGKDLSYLFRNVGANDIDASNLDTSGVTNMEGMFISCQNLTNLNISSFDTSEVENMWDMFAYCWSLVNLDLSGFDTSKVTNMKQMFALCRNLTNINISSFDTSEVEDMRGMFYQCSSLTSLDLTGFKTSNVTSMQLMFAECGSLTTLDLSGFNTSKVTDMKQMFAYCNNLTTLNISSFDTFEVEDMRSMFYQCSSLTAIDLSSFIIPSETEHNYGSGNCFDGCSALLTIKTPKRIKEVSRQGALPAPFYDSEYNFYTKLPSEPGDSILLTRGPLDVSDAEVTTEAEEYVYSGEAYEPQVAVKFAGKIIDPEHYSVSYSDNVYVGTATVTVTFSGDYYTGTATGHFKITLAPPEGEEIEIVSEEGKDSSLSELSEQLSVEGAEGWEVSWSIEQDDRKIASITSDGVLKLKEYDKEATVIVTLEKGTHVIIKKKKYYAVAPKLRASGGRSMKVNKSKTIKATFDVSSWSGGSKVSFSSKGKRSCSIRAKKKGSVTITAKGKKGTRSISITIK